MKCFLFTLSFCCIAVVAYSQSTFPLPKGIQNYKNNLNPATGSKSYYNPLPVAGKNSPQNNMPCYKPDMSVISIIPTLRLWLLPVSIPNPFFKEED